MIFKFHEIEIPALIAKKAHEEMEKKARSKKENTKSMSAEQINVEDSGSQKDLILVEKETKSERKKRAAYTVSATS